MMAKRPFGHRSVITINKNNLKTYLKSWRLSHRAQDTGWFRLMLIRHPGEGDEWAENNSTCI